MLHFDGLKNMKRSVTFFVLMFGVTSQVPGRPLPPMQGVSSQISHYTGDRCWIGPAANIDNSGSCGHRLQQIMGGLQRYLAEPKGQPDIYCWSRGPAKE